MSDTTQAQHLKAAAQQALTVLRGCLEHPDAGDAISALEHAIAQPAKPEPVDAWQPIETAPKDGSMILLGKLANIDDDDWAISTAGFWQEAAEDSADDMSLDAGFVDAQYQQFVPARSFGLSHYRSLGCQPTHWQPLPTPPNGITLKETP